MHLIHNVSVSHYRLSIHLIIAITIISSIFWLILNIKNQENKIFFKFKKKYIPYLILIFLIYLQIIFGAFVSGLDAGNIYQTWPLMGFSYFPNDLIIENYKNIFNFDVHSLVQFYHRNLAYLITIYIIFLSVHIYRRGLKKLFNPMKILLFFLIFQIILGILTLVSGLNIYLASAHQISSVVLVFSAINLYFYRTK